MKKVMFGANDHDEFRSIRTDVPVPDGYTTALVLLKGALRVNGSAEITPAEVGLFDRAGNSISIECVKDTTALLLCGGPIDEPIVGQGRFVMNTSRIGPVLQSFL